MVRLLGNFVNILTLATRKFWRRHFNASYFKPWLFAFPVFYFCNFPQHIENFTQMHLKVPSLTFLCTVFFGNFAVTVHMYAIFFSSECSDQAGRKLECKIAKREPPILKKIVSNASSQSTRNKYFVISPNFYADVFLKPAWSHRVARWYIFKPKFPILVCFWGPWIIIFRHTYFMAIRYFEAIQCMYVCNGLLVYFVVSLVYNFHFGLV
jgi:hypothetical protein